MAGSTGAAPAATRTACNSAPAAPAWATASTARGPSPSTCPPWTAGARPRRGGFATKAEAQIALNTVLDCERTGVLIDDEQTVAHYLHDWLQRKVLVLKPTTIANYQRYVRNDLIPALGAIKLEKLRPQHVDQFVHDQLDAGRGATTLRDCVATLSSALGDTVRQRRLRDNPARYAAIPIPAKPERTCWTPGQAVRFLQYCAEIDCGEHGFGVIDVGQGVADEQHPLIQVHVGPVQCEGFASPQAGADDQLEELC